MMTRCHWFSLCMNYKVGLFVLFCKYTERDRERKKESEVNEWEGKVGSSYSIFSCKWMKDNHTKNSWQQKKSIKRTNELKNRIHHILQIKSLSLFTSSESRMKKKIEIHKKRLCNNWRIRWWLVWEEEDELNIHTSFH